MSERGAAGRGRVRSGGRRMARLAQAILLYAVLALVLVLLLAPIGWMLTTSLKRAENIWNMPPEWLPDPLTFANYAEIFRRVPFAWMALNSVKVAVLSTLGILLSCSLAGYAFARFRFPGRTFLFLLALSTLMIPNQVTMIPQFVVMRSLGWLDTHEALYVPAFFGGVDGALNVFLFRQFFMTVSQELLDAAKIDGCNPVGAFARIVVPVCQPVFATVTVINFLGFWNAVLSPAIYLTSWDKFTLPIGLSMFRSMNVDNYHLIMAAALVSVLPVLLLYLFAQRYFVNAFAFTAGIRA